MIQHEVYHQLVTRPTLAHAVCHHNCSTTAAIATIGIASPLHHPPPPRRLVAALSVGWHPNSNSAALRLPSASAIKAAVSAASEIPKAVASGFPQLYSHSAWRACGRAHVAVVVVVVVAVAVVGVVPARACVSLFSLSCAHTRAYLSDGRVDATDLGEAQQRVGVGRGLSVDALRAVAVEERAALVGVEVVGEGGDARAYHRLARHGALFPRGAVGAQDAPAAYWHVACREWWRAPACWCVTVGTRCRGACVVPRRPRVLRLQP